MQVECRLIQHIQLQDECNLNMQLAALKLKLNSTQFLFHKTQVLVYKKHIHLEVA